MTDESRPDDIEDPKPGQDEQSLAGTGNEEQDDLDTAREMETIVPTTPDELDSATIPGVEPGQDRIVLEGDAVPGYDLLGELGRGGMGVVYKARDQKLKRIVALKMILSGTHASDEDMQRFQTEAEAVARLQHPNIVQIFEVAEHEGRPYIALEFADGGSLDQKIAGTPQNATESAELVETLARAMQQAHENEIIHRDLKPANILLTADGEPRITDFGLAKRMDEDSSQTKSGAVMGTPSYMAPEQAASNSATLGPAADTYALGAILYHMLTGRPPFQAETQLDTIMQVIAEEPVAPRKLNSSLPVDLETICLKCLEKDAHRRYESAEALAEDLRRFQAGEPIQARPVSVITRGLKWAKRRPAVAGMVGISAAALVALVAGGLWYNAQLVKERDIARHQRTLAEKQTELADKNFELARDAVDEYMTKVSETQLLNVPRMSGLRRELLEGALTFYEKFSDQKSDSPELKMKFAIANINAGRIQFRLGDYKVATTTYQSGIAKIQELVNAYPEEVSYQITLASQYGDFGERLAELGERAQSAELTQHAVALHQAVAAKEPGNLRNQLIMGGTFRDYGRILLSLGRFEEAFSMYQYAESTLNGLEGADLPEGAATKRTTLLANVYSDLAIFYQKISNLEQSLLTQEKAVALYASAAEAAPDDINKQERLAFAYHNQAGVLSLVDPAEAIVIHRKGMDILKQLAEDHPGMPRRQLHLQGAYNNLGLIQVKAGEFAEGIKNIRIAIDGKSRLFEENPGIPLYENSLANSYMILSEALYASGETEKSLVETKHGIDLFKDLFHRFPQEPARGEKVARSHIILASRLADIGHYEGAIRAYTEATVVYETLEKNFPGNAAYTDSLATTLKTIDQLRQKSDKELEENLQK